MNAKKLCFLGALWTLILGADFAAAHSAEAERYSNRAVPSVADNSDLGCS